MKWKSRIVLGLNLVAACVLVGCQDGLIDRSLIFSTGTTLGVEVSVNPTETTAGPVKLVLGYKRAEAVVNPVYHSKGVTGPATTTDTTTTAPAGGGAVTTRTVATSTGVERYRHDAFSVIAKFTGEAGAKAGATADGKLAIGQWFATGHAADLLAVQPGIAGAVSGSSEIAKEAAKQKFTLPSGSLSETEIALNVLEDIGRLLSGATDPVAKTKGSALLAIDQDVPLQAGLSFYVFDSSLNPAATRPEPNVYANLFAVGMSGLARLKSYREYLIRSIDGLDRVLAGGPLVDAAGTAVTVNPAKTTALSKERQDLVSARDRLDKGIAESPKTVDAVTYFRDWIVSGKP